jgi:hypothetical protein
MHQLLQLPNPPTNPSPPLENPAVTPGEDDGEGMLAGGGVERKPEEASEEPNKILMNSPMEFQNRLSYG